MSKKTNEYLRNYVLQNIERFRMSNGKVAWTKLVQEARQLFPYERITYDRIRWFGRQQDTERIKTVELPNNATKYGQIIQSSMTGDQKELTITIDPEKINSAKLTKKDIMKLFELDDSEWECQRFDIKTWNTTLKDSTGKPNQVTNYGVHAVFKPIKGVLKKEDLSWIYESAREASIKQHGMELDKYYYNHSEIAKENTLVLAIFDQHLGKLAWGEETGENYDIKIASKRFLSAAKYLIDKANEVGFSKILFPLGNDFFQFDSMNSETTRGTKVDSDIRWKKLFRVGIDLLREVLEYAATFAPVDVMLIQGNHDHMMSFYAFETLRGYYENNPNIIIDKNIKTRSYRLVGINLLGFTHGDKEQDNIYRVMQEEARELWGRSKHAEFIVGHYHKSAVDEKQGVIKRTIGSLTGTDSWHYDRGYVGTLKTAQALIYNERIPGPYQIIPYSIDISQEKEQKH